MYRPSVSVQDINVESETPIWQLKIKEAAPIFNQIKISVGYVD